MKKRGLFNSKAGLVAWVCGWLALLVGFIILFPACTLNNRMTRVEFTQTPSGESTAWMSVDASGASNTTTTTQDAKGELAAALEGAQAALQGIKDAAAKYAPDLSSVTDSHDTTYVPPAPTPDPVVEDIAVPAEPPAENQPVVVEEIE